MTTSASKTEESSAVAGLTDTSRKVEAALLPAIEEHVTNSDFDASRDGLDFLHVKNTMLLSYLIDLVNLTRQDLSEHDDSRIPLRLTEMKTALDKMRPMEKKMRYQLNKLLTTSTSTSFASAGTDDPLQYRPDPKAFESTEDGSSDGDSEDENDEHSSGEDDDDDELAAAKATVARARIKGKSEDDHEDGLYRAPRLASMPYPLDDDRDGTERQKRLDRRLQTSELVQTLRSQYGETPEQEDVHGSSDFGTQREAARRLAQREAEKIRFEEDTMVRLTTSRKEKKERKRLMRDESSNLAAISDLGNLVRGVSAAFHDDDDNIDDYEGDGLTTERYDNGKRKRSAVDPVTGRKKGRKSGREAKNSLQMALYGSGGKSKKKKRR